MGVSLTFMEFIGIVLAGNLVLGIYTGALAHIAAKTGLSTHLLAKYAFGAKVVVSAFIPARLHTGRMVRSRRSHVRDSSRQSHGSGTCTC